MITTVTTTVTTLTTVVSLGMVAVITMLILLVNKEIISGSTNQYAQRLSKSLNVALVPLMIVFAITAGLKLAEAMM